jgi:peptidoglycan/LPS O-acetylase OafA/YrhL
MRDFYVRRVLRILPPFYVVLALACVGSAVGFVSHSLSLEPMLALALHYANYWAIFEGTSGQPPGTGVYWSLAVEEHFYFVFPVLFVFLQRAFKGRGAAQAFVLLGICAAILAWRYYLVLALHVPETRTFLATDTRVDSILFGCALAVAANPMLDPPRISRELLLYVLLPAGVFLIGITFVVRDDSFRETLRYSLQGLGLAPIFVAAMREPSWGPFKLLNWPFARRIGGLSYSLYLVHQIFLLAFIDRFPQVPQIVRASLALVLSFVLAEAIQRTVEKPCARLRRKFAHATWLSSWQPPPKAQNGTAAAA